MTSLNDNEDIKQESLDLTDIQDENDFQKIIQSIDAMYKNNKPFEMMIETNKVTKIQMKYIYRIGKYLHNIKNTYPKLLRYTCIHVYNNAIYNILYMLFTHLSNPISKVTVIQYEPNAEKKEIKQIKNFYPRH